MKVRTLLLWSAALGGLQVLAAGPLDGILPPQWARFVVLVVAALTAATSIYGHGLVTPVPQAEVQAHNAIAPSEAEAVETTVAPERMAHQTEPLAGA